MQNYLLRIRKIKQKIIALKEEDFEIVQGGTHYKVFLSDNYVVRFRDDNSKLLLREVNFLKQLKHPLIPKVLWAGRINKYEIVFDYGIKSTDLIIPRGIK
jgi:serine/threonine protein kinase